MCPKNNNHKHQLAKKCRELTYLYKSQPRTRAWKGHSGSGVQGKDGRPPVVPVGRGSP